MDMFGQSDRELAIDALHASTAIYTADPVVNQLLDMLDWPNGTRRLVDPSCGDGAFLGRALERLLLAYPNIDDARLSHVIEGWEIHFFAVSEARARVAGVLVTHGRQAADARALAEEIVRHGDFLLEGPREPVYHAIAGNPPYLRFANVPQPLRDDYERELPDYATADMLHSFLDRCALSLHGDGEIACVTSDRWLFNENAARLREAIGQRLGIAHLERLDVTSAFYRPKLRRRGAPPRIHPVGVVLRHAAQCASPLSKAPVFPGADDEVDAGGPTLGELAKVSIAPWLGTPGIFLIHEEVAKGLPRDELVPAIDTDDITQGVLGKPTRYAIRTRRDVDPSAAVMEHLDRELPRMCARGRKSPRWMPPESFEKFDLSQPYLLVPRIAKTLRPVRVPAGMLAVNHNLSIVAAGDRSLDELEAILSSDKAMEWISRRAPRLENGYFSITTRLLRSLPV
ncbi:Eco57I restriction-modification methylase domain-containing protein [Methylibium petroleiphilum]|uniref:site-specific DNA-methyltransferase (adenine-specific) n=1 Tax=Methylibium petroleiphilum (strain ATCC BAA-1232 / LMG 22953 / PM1) TaxID=420662 RepID=A2SMT8_METPP|nr:N-6 DNA methylase [Methylibium petroleiphilum]ABM96877.1 hypothetical protein Mpe_B0098 [Methylibium petroleiphilum PM1]